MTTIEKIQKLLEITTEHGATPEEAANALAKAQLLLFKNGLTMDDLKTEEEDVIVEEKVSVGTKSVNYIQNKFVQELAPHFACSVLISTIGRQSKFVFIGEKSKVQVFKDCFLFAYNAYKSCWSKEVASMNTDTHSKNMRRVSYVDGFIDGLTNELIKSENEHALVICKSQDLEDYMTKKKIDGSISFSASSRFDYSLYQKGYESGSYAQRNKNKALS